MGDNTGIEWCDATWNPTTGCDKVSPGCDHCYAMTLAPRLKGMGSAHYQLDGDPATSGPGFGYAEHPDALDKPLRWTRPRRIFVNSMSDLFHQSATREFQAQVWAVMALAGQHTFQVLTKRPGVMRSVLSSPGFRRAVTGYAAQIATGEHPTIKVPRNPNAVTWHLADWPLPNVWVGTSVEDQERANLRIPPLLDTPAAVRFLSMEPLLGPVDLTRITRATWQQSRSSLLPLMDRDDPTRTLVPALDWVIVGGESGAGARFMHPEWVHSLLDQCLSAGVPFHFKQWGEWGHALGETRKGDVHLQIGAGPAYYSMRRVGKKAAGRLLGGRTWDGWPVAADA